MKSFTVKPLWIKFEDYHKHFQNLKAVCYAFAFCDVQPKNNIWPFQLKEVCYVGESAGTEPIIDRKNKSKPNKGRLEYPPHRRFKEHMSNMNRADVRKESDTWCRLFFEHFGYGPGVVKGTLTGKPCYVCILICPETEKFPKAWVKLVEQEMIYEYQNAFGHIPVLNSQEKNGSSDSKKTASSLSQTIYQEIKKQNLFDLAGV
jgi:hypothetical protein